MNKLFLGLLIALSFSFSWACPDISGEYECASKEGSFEELEIVRTEKKGVITYSINGDAFVANGKSIKYDLAGLPIDVTLKCAKGSEDIVIAGSGSDATGGTLVEGNLSMKFSSLATDIVGAETSIEAFENGASFISMDDIAACVKIK